MFLLILSSKIETFTVKLILSFHILSISMSKNLVEPSFIEYVDCGHNLSLNFNKNWLKINSCLVLVCVKRDWRKEICVLQNKTIIKPLFGIIFIFFIFCFLNSENTENMSAEKHCLHFVKCKKFTSLPFVMLKVWKSWKWNKIVSYICSSIFKPIFSQPNIRLASSHHHSPPRHSSAVHFHHCESPFFVLSPISPFSLPFSSPFFFSSRNPGKISRHNLG